VAGLLGPRLKLKGSHLLMKLVDNVPNTEIWFTVSSFKIGRIMPGQDFLAAGWRCCFFVKIFFMCFNFPMVLWDESKLVLVCLTDVCLDPRTS
jgi:hypothetical protein